MQEASFDKKKERRLLGVFSGYDLSLVWELRLKILSMYSLFLELQTEICIPNKRMYYLFAPRIKTDLMLKSDVCRSVHKGEVSKVTKMLFNPFCYENNHCKV